MSGLDIFQGTDDAPRGGVVPGPSRDYHDVGSDRSLAAAQWNAMSAEEQAPYLAKAHELNAEREQERASTPTVGPDDALVAQCVYPPSYPRSS